MSGNGYPEGVTGERDQAYWSSATTPRCTCHPVPEHLHTTHYGATEPGSTLEPDPDCPVHFPGGEPCMSADLATGWDPDKCACRWGEQPCDRCLPVLDARLRDRQMQKALGPTVERMRATP